MQNGRFAVAASGCEKSSHADCPAKGGCLQPAGGFAQGQNSNFHFHQALCIIFDLRGCVLQHSFADRYAGRGMAQGLARDQFAGEFDTVQPFFPYQ